MPNMNILKLFTVFSAYTIMLFIPLKALCFPTYYCYALTVSNDNKVVKITPVHGNSNRAHLVLQLNNRITNDKWQWQVLPSKMHDFQRYQNVDTTKVYSAHFEPSMGLSPFFLEFILNILVNCLITEGIIPPDGLYFADHTYQKGKGKITFNIKKHTTLGSRKRPHHWYLVKQIICDKNKTKHTQCYYLNMDLCTDQPFIHDTTKNKCHYVLWNKKKSSSTWYLFSRKPHPDAETDIQPLLKIINQMNKAL